MSTEVTQSLPFAARFRRLAVTNVLATLMVPLAGLIDIAFLGHLDEIHYLAGVALATVLFDSIYWGLGFLRMGTTGMTAQAQGRGDEDEVGRIFMRAGAMAFTFGLLILLCSGPLREVGFALLQGSEEVEKAGRDYWAGRIWAAPFTLMGFVFLGWFLGQERGGVVLLLSAVVNLSNVALDYYLIVVLGQASWGAGMATALSQVVMCVVALGVLIPRAPGFWRLKKDAWTWVGMRALLVFNRDLMIRTLVLLLTFAFFTNLASIMGTTVLAANAILMKVQMLAAYIVDGLAYATEALAGIYLGEGNRRKLKQLVWVAGRWGVAAGSLVAVAFAVEPALLYGLLTDHVEVLARLRRDTLWLLPILSVGSLAFILDGYFIGLTEGRVLVRSMFWASGLGFLPLATAAWFWHSPDLLWSAMTGLMALRAVSLLRHVPATWSREDER